MTSDTEDVALIEYTELGVGEGASRPLESESPPSPNGDKAVLLSAGDSAHGPGGSAATCPPFSEPS